MHVQLFISIVYLLRATKTIPTKTKTAPKTKIVAGTSAKISMPRKVAPTGSSRAMVAVSNDFRCEREEK